MVATIRKGVTKNSHIPVEKIAILYDGLQKKEIKEFTRIKKTLLPSDSEVARSMNRKGTTFPTVSIKDVPASSPDAQDDPYRPVVLVVDDESMIADSLADILKRSGYAAVPAYDGEAALEIAFADAAGAAHLRCGVAGNERHRAGDHAPAHLSRLQGDSVVRPVFHRALAGVGRLRGTPLCVSQQAGAPQGAAGARVGQPQGSQTACIRAAGRGDGAIVRMD